MLSPRGPESTDVFEVAGDFVMTLAGCSGVLAAVSTAIPRLCSSGAVWYATGGFSAAVAAPKDSADGKFSGPSETVTGAFAFSSA